MHHPKFQWRLTLGGLLLALWLVSTLCAQQTLPPPPAKGATAGSAGVIVPIGGSRMVQMSGKQRIASVENPKPIVARVQQALNDPTTVIVSGLESGLDPIVLVDEQGKRETIEVIVQLDIELLRSILQRTLPTATIEPIPSSANTVVLTGNLAHQEDVEVAMRVAASVAGGPDRVVNGLRVGGVMQVQLDVAVARVLRDKLREMSFDFMNFGGQHILASTVGGGFVIPSAGITGTFPGSPIITNSVGSPNGVPSNLFLAIFSPKQDFFGLLQALKTESLVKVNTKPSLVTLSGQRASFLDGGEQAIPVPAGLGQVGVQFEEFGTRLNFLPIVLGNGKIQLEVEPEVSVLNAANGTSINGTVVPGRDTQRIHTTVQLEDGQTYVLGGIIQHRVTGTTVKVPIVGEIPFLGAAFSRKSFDEQDEELVILVTPHLIDGMSCDQAPKMLPGDETRSADDFELFLEGIMEAPRGPRAVCPNNRYVPAFKNGPTSGVFPCGDNCGSGAGGCGVGGSAAAHAPGCVSTAPVPATSLLPMSATTSPDGAAPVAGMPPTLPADLTAAGPGQGK